jgi:undecaprenyl-diphosphatase
MKNKLYYQFAGSCFLLIFMFLGYVVRFYPQWLNGFDQGLTNLIRAPYPHFNQFFIWYTKFANSLTVGIIAVAILALLVIGRYYAEAIWLTVNTAVIAGILNPFIIKPFFMRERPTLPHLVREHSYSFPSGHSLGSMLLYGTLIFLLPVVVKSKPLCRLVQVILGIGIFLIGVSRIYLGVHFPSDVVGGFCLGLAWLFLTYPYYLEKRFVWRFKRKQR